MLNYEQLVLPSVLLGFPGGAFAPDLVNQTQHLFASHQGDSLRELASVAVDHPMTSEGLVDASAGDSHRSSRLPSTGCSCMMSASGIAATIGPYGFIACVSSHTLLAYHMVVILRRAVCVCLESFIGVRTVLIVSCVGHDSMQV